MKVTKEGIERIFGPPTGGFSSGLTIHETGSIAGGLSALFAIGFELLGLASSELSEPRQVIESARVSRLFGEVSEVLGAFIPAIPSVDRSSVLSLSGRLGDFSSGGLLNEVGAIGAIEFVRLYLCEFLDSAISHYLAKCGELSDKSFSRALEFALSVVTEAKERLIFEGFQIENTHTEQLVQLNLIQRIIGCESEVSPIC